MKMETVNKISDSEVEALPQNSEWRRFFKVLLKRKLVLFFGLIILLMVLIAIFAELITPYDPYTQELSKSLQDPSKDHLLGTDSLGRDVLSRIIFGTRTSLIVGIISVALAAVIGGIMGLTAGYFGGIVDTVISRIVDVILAFPAIILALAIAAVIGGGMITIIVALIVGMAPSFARVMRGEVLSAKEQDYIKAAEVIGSKYRRIIFNHLLPNCISPIIVLMTMNLGVAILAEASLSFLGVGITPPQAAWGEMVSEGQRYLTSNPILSFAPGLCVLIAVLAFNIVGDGLRDALDPRLKNSI